jgi:glycosyltransferase involved in cell wall biosynthesis
MASTQNAAGPPVFTIVLPTRDRPLMLRRALASVLAQSGPEVEVIVVDDASSRPAESSITDLLGDPRVRVIRLEVNGGASRARNVGVDAAQGHYLVFLDDDDELAPGFLEQVEARFQSSENRVGCVGCAATIVRYAGDSAAARRCEEWASSLEGPGVFRKQLLSSPATRFIFSGMSVRAELARRVRFNPSLRSAVDRDFLIRLSRVCDLAAIADPLVTIHMHHGPKINRYSPEKAAAYRHLLDENEHDLRLRPRSLAAFRYKTAWLHYATGDRRATRTLALGAIRADPTHLRAWLLLSGHLLPAGVGARLHRAGSKVRKAIRRGASRIRQGV